MISTTSPEFIALVLLGAAVTSVVVAILGDYLYQVIVMKSRNNPVLYRPDGSQTMFSQELSWRLGDRNTRVLCWFIWVGCECLLVSREFYKRFDRKLPYD